MPVLDAENGLVVGLPDDGWALGGEVPDREPSVCVGCEQAGVLFGEADGGDVGAVAAEDVGWLRRRRRRRRV